MLSVISIGIGNYDIDERKIGCVRKDCTNIYNSFKRIMGEEFAEHTSVCLTDLVAAEFMSILNSLKFSFESRNDKIIIYFSGHASNVLSYDKIYDLVLEFSDYNKEKTRGAVSLRHQVMPILNMIVGDVVLILDCCFSGSSLFLASTSISENRISILSSTSESGLAMYSDDGSEFTRCICESIQEIELENEEFTLNNLQTKISARCPKACFNMGAGKSGGVVFKCKNDLNEIYLDFPKKFLNRISESNSNIREVMWYSLNDLPFNLTKNIYYEGFRCNNPDCIYPLELNWLVRRAIGSSISCIESRRQRITIASPFLESKYWQEQCIGLIGLRYDIANDKELFELIVDKIKKEKIKKIDAVWLANLYLSDNKQYDYKFLLETSLLNNPWGINEIYKSACNASVKKEDFLAAMPNSCCSVQEWKRNYFNKKDLGLKIYDIISNRDHRGRLPINSKAKFLLSSLYGNWRGSVIVSLIDYLETEREDIICRELIQSSSFCEVEYRMAIFDFLANESSITIKYSNELKWGLSDTHPWVRRSAIKAFKEANIFHEECNQSILEYASKKIEHIGEFDLFLEFCAETEDKLDCFMEHIQKNDRFTKAEIDNLYRVLHNDLRE